MGGFYIEGAFAYVEVTDENGAEVERFEDPEYHLAKEIARVTLPAGRYEVATYVRPCEAACPRLDGPTDRCELTVDLAAAGTVEVLVQRQVGQPCNATTVAMPATPGTSPLTSLRLTTEFREHCGSIGGCAAYVALMPAGVSEAIEAELTGQGSDEHALPALIAPGSYTVRFRLAALSDDRQVGAPAEEATIATCELPIEVLTQAAVNITVIFDRNSCEANATYTIVIVD